MIHFTWQLTPHSFVTAHSKKFCSSNNNNNVIFIIIIGSLTKRPSWPTTFLPASAANSLLPNATFHLGYLDDLTVGGTPGDSSSQCQFHFLSLSYHRPPSELQYIWAVFLWQWPWGPLLLPRFWFKNTNSVFSIHFQYIYFDCIVLEDVFRYSQNENGRIRMKRFTLRVESAWELVHLTL